MTSILTNTSAMNALQTLKTINYNLNKTQEQIATGKDIGSAADNAAIWAISKVMESDVAGFKGISDSLGVGESTVSVARTAAETITDLLKKIKEKIVAAQAENVDRTKLQTDIVALREQVTSVVDSAQFNGLNLVNGTVATSVNVLASLNRSSTGTVTSSSIAVASNNLSLTAGTAITNGGLTTSITPGTALAIATTPSDATGDDSITLSAALFLTAAGAADGAVALANDTAGVVLTEAGGLVEGDVLSLTIGTVAGTYTVKEDDTVNSILSGLKNSLLANGIDTSKVSFTTTTPGEMNIENLTNATMATSFSASRGSGGLAALSSLSVATAATAATALANIETMITTAINAGASFGSSEGRIIIQQSFLGELTDALTTGIGTLVDADMEEVSARLQALQVQQQLGIQALAIANSAPQNVLSLFQ